MVSQSETESLSLTSENSDAEKYADDCITEEGYARGVESEEVEERQQRSRSCPVGEVGIVVEEVKESRRSKLLL
jgi:hypothetical protein